MIIGTGIDIIDIPRFALVFCRDSFQKKIYTPAELAYLKSRKMDISTAAGMFCVKEAAAKALGRGFDCISWQDIEVMHNEFGRPLAHLSGRAQQLMQQQGGTTVHISISHVSLTAVANCIIEG